ncbi:ribonucleoside-diphosphate reductase subunit alpha [Evansella cellulosilytica]|uniref:Ribonucleoside-diphosphate reductase n=1 Tax=Evansella cellulosilytica (strain ATCC 21833 / DSM 2522 / FERM P-1141 / JCM 9156 / N-4) TaxID=649639 RepID=E6TY99_EVAC2|nr:ribonucleoside-diphosphate reductase subunit alpha [Evansella cellulosilytica]ADU32418.1 ribonucleoside-diphosphate reductase, alpha subunit [Evansella cellulosilytica DSM 2522]
MNTLVKELDVWDELKKKYEHLNWGNWHFDKSEKDLLLAALDRISSDEPDWTYVAATIRLQQLYKQVAEKRQMRPEEVYTGFAHNVTYLVEAGFYDQDLAGAYQKDDLERLEAALNKSNDSKFTYLGLHTLIDRYLTRDHEGHILELPQERFMIIAMTLMKEEKQSKRLDYVLEAYWALSNLYMTVATPTLSNAGKTHGQLSSCFIDTMDDSLRGIFDSTTDAATLSKNGGGIGIYLGKIRAKGSSIKGFKGTSSGVLPWMKQLNNTAVSVDQLGQRQGAIAVYLDVWHKDIFSFLDAKLNNGDERKRTHDLFTGVCLPDLFMEKVEAREAWFLFDPHEVRQTMGFSLEDFYDEERGAGSFREKYEQCVRDPRLSKESVPAIEIMKRVMISQLETGTPYMFYRDEANRQNPNAHCGMMYGSNLCTEIMQNMSATTIKEETTEDGKILITKEAGDYVVCNLSSINLATAVTDGVLSRLIPIQVRMLDNVIDINNIEVPQARLTNEKYRAIGLGTFGWHHLLAITGLRWESEEAINFADKLYEKIAYLTIEASMELAKEKGAYEKFENSAWHTGKYFSQRNYTDEKWIALAEMVNRSGLRNGYLMAVAPNSSTAIIAGTTASIDPIYRKEYAEEKKNFRIPVTAPDISPATTWYYKSAHDIDQIWSVKQNGARQKHIDQGVSFNIYVKNTVKAKELLDIHLSAWKHGLKSTYYVRSTSSEIDECESCAS